MKVLCITALLVLVTGISALGQQKCKEYAPQGSVVAFCPPAGWSAQQEKGEKHLSFESPGGKSAASIIVKEDTMDAPLGALALTLIGNYLHPASPDKSLDTSLIDLADYKTDSGAAGPKLVFKMIGADKVPLLQTIYMFSAPGNVKVTLMCTSLAGDDAANAAIERSVKTLRIGK